jgi:uncharacterized protein YndB with AHSA1/START domain
MQTEPIELQVDIERSAQDVFEYIRDFDKAPEWQADALEVTSDPPGAAGVGTRVHMKRSTPLGAQSFTVEVTSLDEGARTMRDETQDGSFAGTVVDWAVDEVDGHSRLRIRMVADVQGFAATLLRLGFARRKMLESASHTWSQNLARLASQMKEG